MAESVRVAVRVRPFNGREKERNATLVIGMSGNTTTIKNPEEPKAEPKKFAFDYSYWSHDGFKENKNGYFEPSSAKYADQAKVFEDLGKGVLDNAWNGYNTSLFAYGQTGSGKSYSMVGYGANKGIVPVASEELFKGIEEKKKTASKDEEFQVMVSMLEIYSEQVRDLLNPASLKLKGGLKVRQDPGKGFVVNGLKTLPVNSYKEIEAKISEGTKNRTVAATNMNATSSRAHTIVAINFAQKSNASGQSMTKSSVINLVDLAGSERAESTGATGDRLKEGSAINQSLSSLGNVIKALADQSSGKKNVMVPYRDSVLTKLLKNALGGNSKTIMIAALSPADINYAETLSTLRFADRAKSIKTQAVINESPTDKLIRELKEENAKLMEMLKKGGGVMPMDGDGAPPPAGGYTEEQVAEMKREMEEQMKRNQEEMEEMNKSWEQRLQGVDKEYQEKLEEEKKKSEMKKSVPHFWNLNEDEALTGMIIHFTPEGKTVVGSSKAEKQPDIALTGLGIQNEHAILLNKKDKVTIKPCPGAKLTLNGNIVKAEKELHHHDRVVFGSSLLFVFHHPKDYAKLEKSGKKPAMPTYEKAQEEIAKNSGLMKIAGKGKSKDDLILQEELIQMLPMVAQCNAMSEELDKKVIFKITLVSPQARGQKEGKTEVCVNVKDMATGNEYLWDRNKFINRKFLMEEMYNSYTNGDKDWDVAKERDPFWDSPDEPVLIGNVHLFLQPLAYMIDMEDVLNIMDHRGNEQGRLTVAVMPCKANGKDIGDDYIDSPAELVGRALHFKIQIKGANGIPKKFVKTFCQYKFYLDDKHIVTKEENGMTPTFNFSQQHDYNPCTDEFVNYLSEKSLVIDVYGRQKSEAKNTNLNTKEMMVREKTKMMKPSSRAKGSGPKTSLERSDSTESNTQAEQSKLSSDVVLLKKRQERANDKLNKIQHLVNNAKDKKEATIKVEDLEKILSVGYKFRAVANLAALTSQAKRDAMGKNTSQACEIQ